MSKHSVSLNKTLTMQTEVISGLVYCPDIINEDVEKELISRIDNLEWSNELNRRVQHYGFYYNYQDRRIANPATPIPDFLVEINQMLIDHGLIAGFFDQVIINEYEPGQGISNHIDSTTSFDNVVVSLSLGSPCVMDFISKTKQKISLFIQCRSLLVMKDEARYLWKHGIPARKKDVWDGTTYERKRRVSITFRKVKGI